jgi:hypothetical protein
MKRWKVLVSRDGFCDAAAVVYAHGVHLKNPLLSPVYGEKCQRSGGEFDHLISPLNAGWGAVSE